MLEARDYIGWDNELLVADIQANPSLRMAKWVFKTWAPRNLDHKDDFRKRHYKNVDFKKTAEAIEALRSTGRSGLHKRLSDKKIVAQPHEDWEAAAKTHLFSAKRAGSMQA